MAPKKKISNSVDVKSLLETYQKADDAVTEARAALDAAMAARSQTVLAIVNAKGDAKGIYPVNGVLCKIRKRDTKDDNGVVTGTTWFFVTVGDEVVDINA